MTQRDLFRFLFKWQGTLAGLFALAMAMASVAIFMLPPGYVATARVLVERNRAPILRSVLAPGMDLVEALNTEMAILLSRSVMEAVVDDVKPHERPRNPSWIGDQLRDATAWLEDQGWLYAQPPRERWIEILQKNVKVRPSIDASVLQVTFGDDDAAWAARLVNAVLKHYVTQHIRVFTVEGPTRMLAARLQQVEGDLRQRRQELAAVKKQGALGALDDAKRDLVRQGGVISEQLTAAHSALETALQKYDAPHPEVQLAQSRIGRLKDSAREVDARLQKLEGEQARLDTLRLEIGALEADWRDLSRRHDEARLTEQGSATAVNVTPVDFAAVPSRPPYSRLLLMLVALVGSAVFALLVALVREYFDRRLSDPSLAEELLGIPELGSVGVLSMRQRRGLASVRRSARAAPSAATATPSVPAADATASAEPGARGQR